MAKSIVANAIAKPPKIISLHILCITHSIDCAFILHNLCIPQYSLSANL